VTQSKGFLSSQTRQCTYSQPSICGFCFVNLSNSQSFLWTKRKLCTFDISHRCCFSNNIADIKGVSLKRIKTKFIKLSLQILILWQEWREQRLFNTL